jgi:GH43 family beta-xylosidase
MNRRTLLKALAAAPIATTARAALDSPETFTNPIAGRGADPWVIRHEETYYYCYSRGGIHVRESPRLEAVDEGRVALAWDPPPGTPYSEELWAPELHRLDGKWYIYVAADDGENANHRMYALERDDPDPVGPFTLKGKVSDPSDKWAIDGTAYRHEPDGRLYFVWSGWEGDVNVRQDLYIAPMSDPWTISGERRLISTPTHDWERIGDPEVNEGPEFLTRDGAVHIVYSASGSWTDHYCLGRLTLTGDDPLDPDAWTKHPEPVFEGTDEVISPGHASFTTSPDGTEDWIVYHVARHPGAGWDRVVHMQPFTWNDRNEPVFGRPIPPGVPIPVPLGSP